MARSTSVMITIEPDEDSRLTGTLEAEVSSDVDPPDPSVGINGPVPLGPEEVLVYAPEGDRAPTKVESGVIFDYIERYSDWFDERVVEQLAYDEEAAYEAAMEHRAEMAMGK